MVNKYITYELKDWSKINRNCNFLNNIDLMRSEKNFGIHTFNGDLWTSGYVGISRIYDKYNKPIKSEGKEHILIVSSQYDLNPWYMLEKVIMDDEYELYLEELKYNNKSLYNIFYEQPVIRLEKDQIDQSEILIALSFINSCYSLCKKGIKKKMYYKEENYSAKVRGKIDIKKNIRNNTSKGRNDRFYCKYIEFTTDNIENRILKNTLIRCKKILEQRFNPSIETNKRISFCLNIFKGVRNIQISSKDFNSTEATGLYIYYKPLLLQARAISNRKYSTYSSKNAKTLSESTYVIPYIINMESIFEFYVRVILKELFKHTQYKIDKYSNKFFIEKGVTDQHQVSKKIHLMPYCIPDIVIREKFSEKIVGVLDAKYKDHEKASRNDTLQLLSYVLITGADKCGFVFPGEKTKIKNIVNNKSMFIETPLISNLEYYEIIFGNDMNSDMLKNSINEYIQNL